MHDMVIRSGNVVDGTGTKVQKIDIAIDDGRITELGTDI